MYVAWPPHCLRVMRAAEISSFHPSVQVRWISRPTSTKPTVAYLLRNATASQGSEISINGFIRSVRSQKSQSFVHLGDGSSLQPIQAVIAADQAESLTTGAAVSLTGSWIRSPGKGQTHELQVSHVELHGPSDATTFPIQKKYQTQEFLRNMPHLRPRTPFNSLLLRLRSEAISALTVFFNKHHFIQVHTPIITSSDCEGGGEVFTVIPANNSTAARQVDTADHVCRPDDLRGSSSMSDMHNKQNTANAQTGVNEHYFRAPRFLTVSSQLHLEALTQAVGNVWTLSPTFRAEKSDTSRHLAEFYMLEVETSFVKDLESIMQLNEEMLKHLTRTLFPSSVGQELLQRPFGHIPDMSTPEQVETRWRGMMNDEAWPRITYTEAVQLLQTAESSKQATFAFKPRWGEALQAEHERFIASHVGKGCTPVFVTHFPGSIKAFYMRQSAEVDAKTTQKVVPGATVDCYDLIVPEHCEIAGGSMREHRLNELMSAMKARGMTIPSYSPAEDGNQGANTDSRASAETQSCPLDWYVDLRRWGCPPHGGFGLGFDRLVCYLSGIQSVRDSATFPRWHGRCDC